MDQTPTKIVPIQYGCNAIKKYVNFYNYPHKSSRLKVINKIFDLQEEHDEKPKEKIKFKDIKVIGQKYDSQYDDCFISDFIEYCLNEYQSVSIQHKIQNEFYRLLDYLGRYLVCAKDYNDSESILSFYKEYIAIKKYEYYPESELNDNATLEELERFCVDNLFQYYSPEKQYLIKQMRIPIKKSKNSNGFSWEEINTIKQNINELTTEQQQLFTYVNDLKSIAKSIEDKSKKNAFYEIINSLEISLRTQIGELNQFPRKRAEIEDPEEQTIKKIEDNFDYSNPLHITGLIFNFFDLHSKYMYQAGSPIYIILNHFQDVLNTMKLSKKHRKVLNQFINITSNERVVAKTIGMKTNDLTNMIKRTIAPKISKEFKVSA